MVAGRFYMNHLARSMQQVWEHGGIYTLCAHDAENYPYKIWRFESHNDIFLVKVPMLLDVTSPLNPEKLFETVNLDSCGVTSTALRFSLLSAFFPRAYVRTDDAMCSHFLVPDPPLMIFALRPSVQCCRP